jgi:hypothetical protein
VGFKILNTIHLQHQGAAMPATFSAENRLNERMKILGVSAAFIAALGRVLPSVLSDAFRGNRALSNEKATELLLVTSRLIELVDAVKPLQLPLKNAADTIRILDHLEHEGIDAPTVRTKISALFSQDQ